MTLEAPDEFSLNLVWRTRD